MAAIAKNYESSVKKGRFTQEVAGQRIDSIQTRTDYEGFEEADLIIEAAFESMELKKRIFRRDRRVAKTGLRPGDQYIHAATSTKSPRSRAGRRW